ncbi:putative SKP1/BTB/POZ domain superfamily protein [Septoria linicola]|nr:putative SKP1/BTB/POZ domain superfamily protein [Septoria linicola]
MAAVRQWFEQLDSARIPATVGSGATIQTFQVPEAILRKVAWFDNALKDDRFLEDQQKSITLPEDLPGIFEQFLCLLYQRRLLFAKCADGVDITRENNSQLVDCLRLWVFGDKYLVPLLQNTAMQRICGLMACASRISAMLVMPDTLKECFAVTEGYEVLQRIVADYVVLRLDRYEDDSAPLVELFSCPGFLKSLHASEKALHSLPKSDFPTYTKPRKFASSFVSLNPDESSLTDNGTTASGHWALNPKPSCDVCGLATSETIACAICLKSKCVCATAPTLTHYCARCSKSEKVG